MIVLFINFLAYLIWTICVYKKYKQLDAYFLLVLMMTIVALLGYLTVATGIYYETFSIKSSTRLDFEPYIYCFIVYFMLFFPLRNMKKKQYEGDFLFGKIGLLFIRFWTIFYTFFALLKMSEVMGAMVMGLGNAYEARHIEGESLYKYNNFILDWIVNGYGLFFYNASYPVILYCAFKGYAQKIFTYNKSLYLILLALLPSFLIGISAGSRGAIFMYVICNFFLVVMFWQLSPKRLKITIKKISFLFFCVLALLSLLITIQRLGNSKDGMTSILRYFGESFPNLGYLMYDRVLVHPMGIRFFPEIMWGDNPPWFSTDDSYLYWYRITGVPVISFKTFFGDFYIEFGLNVTFVLVLIIYLIISFIVQKRFSIITLPIVFLYMRMCSQSFAGYTLVNHVSVFQIEITLLFMIFLYLLKRIYVSSLICRK